MNGKGSRPRNCFSEKFRSNYDAIFRRPQPQQLHELAPSRSIRGNHKRTRAQAKAGATTATGTSKSTRG